MPNANDLASLVQPVVDRLGFALVRVALIGGKSAQTLQVMAEDPATGQLTLDQCADISRALDPVLEEADPIPDGYRLEVSSPGIDRPLTRPADWDRWSGHAVRVVVDPPIAGRKRFEGVILGLADGAARLETGKGDEVALPLAGIAAAKLILTDELIRATRPLSIEGADSIVKDPR